MAAVMGYRCRNTTFRFRNIVGSICSFKSDNALNYGTVRHHHISSEVCRSHSKRAHHKKLFYMCTGRDHINMVGLIAARSASTGVQHEVRWNISEPKSSQVQNGTSAGVSSSSSITDQSISSQNTNLSTPLDNIPEPPAIPPQVEQVVENLTGEPSFESLGLGGWSPVGIVQNCLEYLHIGCDLPWWLSIAIGTVVVRLVMFPLVIVSQRNAAKMTNNMPQIQTLQLKMSEARQMGNQLEAARYAQEMVLFMREKNLNPLKNVMVPLAQAPLFVSFFMGLRKMANVPVESMRTGGLFWFTDLTVPDQYYLMPIITSFTMWVTIEVGADGAKLSAGNLQTMRYVLRALPVVVLPFTINFPGAVLVYWVSTNFISLIQVGFLRIPAVREFFKIEKIVTHNPDSLPVKQKGFYEGLQDSWTNMKITRELEERQRFDEIQFQRAGKGPVQKTYKYDPTQSRKSLNVGQEGIAAKKRDR